MTSTVGFCYEVPVIWLIQHGTSRQLTTTKVSSICGLKGCATRWTVLLIHINYSINHDFVDCGRHAPPPPPPKPMTAACVRCGFRHELWSSNQHQLQDSRCGKYPAVWRIIGIRMRTCERKHGLCGQRLGCSQSAGRLLTGLAAVDDQRHQLLACLPIRPAQIAILFCLIKYFEDLQAWTDTRPLNRSWNFRQSPALSLATVSQPYTPELKTTSAS